MEQCAGRGERSKSSGRPKISILPDNSLKFQRKTFVLGAGSLCSNKISSPYVRIDVACGKNGKRGEREKEESESATNGRV